MESRTFHEQARAMKSKILSSHGERIFAIVFDPGDEVAKGLLQFACDNEIAGAAFTAIGAFEKVTLGWFNLQTRDYEKIPVEQQVEVLSLVGNVALHNDKPKVHAHVVIGKRDGTALGGHLLDAYVRPTLEVMLTEAPRHLRRTHDSKTNLPLINLEISGQRR
jgi:predicted DNA-binding protein with PD1-like motif